MDIDKLNPESAAVISEAPVWDPGPPEDGEDPPIATGAVSCRYLERRKAAVMRWEAHWALFAPYKTEEGLKARVDFHGRRTDMKTEMTATPDGKMLFFCEAMDAQVPLGPLDNVQGNQLRLSGALGILDAITVSVCLKDFGKATSFGMKEGPYV